MDGSLFRSHHGSPWGDRRDNYLDIDQASK